jgi:hypothetical protein
VFHHRRIDNCSSPSNRQLTEVGSVPNSNGQQRQGIYEYSVRRSGQLPCPTYPSHARETRWLRKAYLSPGWNQRSCRDDVRPLGNRRPRSKSSDRTADHSSPTTACPGDFFGVLTDVDESRTPAASHTNLTCFHVESRLTRWLGR